MTSWSDSNLRGIVFQEILGKFMEDNPNCVVVNESVTGEDFYIKLKTDFASGNESDIFAISPDIYVSRLVSAGKVAPMTEFLAEDNEWFESFDKSTWRYVKFNDEIYGLPVEKGYECMFVNTDLFSNLNLEVPKTFTELMDVIPIIKNAGIIPITYNSLDGGLLLYKNIVAKLAGSQGISPLFSDGQVNEHYINAADYMIKLFNAGAFPNDYYMLSNLEAENLFLKKQAAIMINRSDFIGEINSVMTTVQTDSFGNENMTVDIFPFPYIESGNADTSAMIYGVGDGTFFLSSQAYENSAKREYCKKILKSITSAENAEIFAEKTNIITAIKIDNPTVYFSGLMLSGFLLIDSMQEFIGMNNMPIDKNLWDKELAKQFPYVLEGQSDIKEVWRNIYNETLLDNN